MSYSMRSKSPSFSRLLLWIVTAVACVVCVTLLMIRPTIIVQGSDLANVGTTHAGGQVAHTFRLRNPHNYPVLVLPLQNETCACTTIDLGKRVIPPHGSLDATVKVEISHTLEQEDKTWVTQTMPLRVSQWGRSTRTTLALRFFIDNSTKAAR